jgi:hypothetical protein
MKRTHYVDGKKTHISRCYVCGKKFRKIPKLGLGALSRIDSAVGGRAKELIVKCRKKYLFFYGFENAKLCEACFWSEGWL